MTQEDPNRRIQAARVRELCGNVSDMWLWRRLNDDSGFPKPIYIARNRFWRESEVLGWLDAQSQTAAQKNTPPNGSDRVQAILDQPIDTRRALGATRQEQ